MSSEKKIVSIKKIKANQRNAQKSTGPVSIAGKSWSRRNSVKHGLFAMDVVTIGENKLQFEEFNKQLIKELKPIDMLSMQIANKIVYTAWNLRRCDKIQSGLLAYEMQSYEADEYKNKLAEIRHSNFAKTDETKVNYQNLLMGLAFIRDCNSGNATIKLGSYETKLLNRYTKLIEQLKQYKEEQYEQR
jgi:hypothetical protein